MYSFLDELVIYNWLAHECEVKLMDEMLPAWIGKSKGVVVEAPSTWMSDRLSIFPRRKTDVARLR